MEVSEGRIVAVDKKAKNKDGVEETLEQPSGRIQSERGRFRLDREGSCGMMMIESPANGESR